MRRDLPFFVPSFGMWNIWHFVVLAVRYCTQSGFSVFSLKISVLSSIVTAFDMHSVFYWLLYVCDGEKKFCLPSGSLFLDCCAVITAYCTLKCAQLRLKWICVTLPVKLAQICFAKCIREPGTCAWLPAKYLLWGDDLQLLPFNCF